jgi:hypothetical protein
LLAEFAEAFTDAAGCTGLGEPDGVAGDADGLAEVMVGQVCLG